jgi:hypothetical protein
VVGEGLGVSVGVETLEEDRVGVGLGGSSSEQSATPIATRESTATVPAVRAVRVLRMATSFVDGTGGGRGPPARVARARLPGPTSPLLRRTAYSAP